MANWSDLKAAVAEVIKTNGNQEITGQILQNTLSSIISNLGENRTFAGIAVPSTSPGTFDGPVFYLATQTGNYSNFGIELVNGEIAVIINSSDGSWSKNTSSIASTNANRDYLYIGGKAKSSRVIEAGLVDAVLDAYIDYTPVDGKYYVLSLWNKKASGDFYFGLYERDIETEEYAQKILFPKSSGVKIFNDIYLHTVDNSKVLVNWGALPSAPWSISITAADGMALSPRVFRAGTLNDVITLKEQLIELNDDLQNYKKYVDSISIKKAILSANIHNYSTDIIGKSLGTDGLTETVSENHILSDYIEVETGVEYKSNITLRKIWDYKSATEFIDLAENVSTFTPTGTLVRILYAKTYDSANVKFGKSSDDIDVEYKEKLEYKGTELLTPNSDTIKSLQDNIKYIPGANLLNPDAIVFGQVLNPEGDYSGLLHENANYDSSEMISVQSNTEYKGNVTFRRYCEYNSGRTVLRTVDNVSTFTTLADTAFVVLSWKNKNYDSANVKFGKSSDDIDVKYEIHPYDKFNRRIALSEDIAFAADEKFITIQNSDKILFVGSSSTESHYALRNKSWFMKLNDILDWLFVTYAFSGNSAGQITSKLKSNTPSPVANGLTPDKIHPSYVHVGQFGNMSDEGLNGETSDDFIEANKALMLVAQSVFNAKLIVGTGYHDYDQYQLETALKQLADEFGADFIPWGYYNNKIMRSISGYRAYKGFYGAAHPGTRTNNFYYQETLNFFEKWQKPNQSIKLFKPRTGTSDYNYKDNYERAQKFYSVQVGEQSLSNAGSEYYDRLEPTSNYTPFDINQGEYYKLMQKQNVDFGDVLAVEIILPIITPNSVNIYIETTSENISAKLYNNLTDTFEEVSITTSGNIKTITIPNYKYIIFDKIKMLLEGEVELSDIYVGYKGGRVKLKKEENAVLLDYAGTNLIGGTGFDDNWSDNWTNSGELSTYKQSEKYGAEFVDIPVYLNATTSNIIVLQYDSLTRKSIQKTFSQSDLYENKSKNAPLHLRVEIYARMWCNIYDPDRYSTWEGDNNPFTNVPILTTESFDYGTLQVGITGSNGKTALLNKFVGMFWSRVPFDIYLPPFSGEQTISISRKANDINNHLSLEIADVIISVIN